MKQKKSGSEAISGGSEGRVLSASLSVLCCAIVVSAIAVVVCIRVSALKESFDSFMAVASNSKPMEYNSNDYFTVPILELQTKVNAAGGSAYHPARVVSSDAPLISRNVSRPIKSLPEKRTVIVSSGSSLLFAIYEYSMHTFVEMKDFLCACVLKLITG